MVVILPGSPKFGTTKTDDMSAAEPADTLLVVG
jgi:hypothetical protein